MNYKEAVNFIEDLLEATACHDLETPCDICRENAAALAVLRGLAEENVALKTALKELAENIHPEAAYISRVEEYTKLECQFYALQDENAALKAEVERVGKLAWGETSRLEKENMKLQQKLDTRAAVYDPMARVEDVQAALACLESSKSDIVSGGKDDILGEKKVEK